MNHAENIRFDVARGLAALVVFFAHVNQVFVWRFFKPPTMWEMFLGWSARSAVLIFFVLSGFLIVKSIVSNIQRNGYFDPVDYFFSRIARLYPPLIFALLLSVAVVSVIHYLDLPGSSGPLGDVRSSGIAYTANELIQALLLHDGMTLVNGPLWTLYIEAKLYVTAMGAALVFYGRSTTQRSAGVALVVASLWLGNGHYKFWFFAMIWVLGAAANLPAMRLRKMLIASVVFAALVGYCYPTTYLDYVDNKWGHALQAVGSAMVVNLLIMRRCAEVNFPSWLQQTGDFSYTLYVTHFPILILCLSLSLHLSADSFLLALVTAFLATLLTLVVVILIAPVLENARLYKKTMSRMFETRIGHQ